MAFAKGKTVYHGGTGKKIRTMKSTEAAQEEVKRLHKLHNPKKSNRGQRAAKRHGKT